MVYPGIPGSFEYSNYSLHFSQIALKEWIQMNVVKLAESSAISTWSSPSNAKYVAHMVVQRRFQTLQIQTSISILLRTAFIAEFEKG